MDFVSAHRGAIPQTAMGADGQFAHPLVVRAKLAIAAACHGHSKTPSHCVVTEFKDTRALQRNLVRSHAVGYTPPAHGDCAFCEGGSGHEHLLSELAAVPGVTEVEVVAEEDLD